MNNNLAKFPLVKEKIISDPQQVLFALLRKQYSWAHPSVDKKEVAARKR